MVSSSSVKPLRVLLLASSLALAAIGVADPAPAEARRIVAVADIHGAYDAFVELLQRVDVIDKDLQWSGGETIFVQTGDFMDRGPGVRPVMDLLIRLQAQAPEAGGKVVVLLGNHEVLNLVGQFNDVTEEILASFADEDQEATLDRAFKEFEQVSLAPERDWARTSRRHKANVQKQWVVDQALGLVEYIQAIGPQGHYGAWLRTLPAMVVVEDVLFMHAGVTPQLAGWGVQKLNQRLADELARFDDYRSYLRERRRVTSFANLSEIIRGAVEEADGLDWFEAPVEQLISPPQLPVRPLEELGKRERWAPLLRINGWFLLAPEGPMWFRGLARWPDVRLTAEMPGALRQLGVRAVVAGHTPNQAATPSVVQVRAAGQVVNIDTGMLTSAYNGRGSALVLRGDEAEAVYVDGTREALPFAPISSQ